MIEMISGPLAGLRYCPNLNVEHFKVVEISDFGRFCTIHEIFDDLMMIFET